MAKNPTITQLDGVQLLKRVYDESNDSIRVELGVNSGISIQLDSVSDSVTNFPNSTSQKASLDNTSTAVVVPAFSCVGMKSFNLYTNTTSTITGAQVCTLQVSPSDTDNVWISTSLTVTPSGTNATVVMGTAVSNIVARRARVSIASAITSGTFDIYAVTEAV